MSTITETARECCEDDYESGCPCCVNECDECGEIHDEENITIKEGKQ